MSSFKKNRLKYKNESYQDFQNQFLFQPYWLYSVGCKDSKNTSFDFLDQFLGPMKFIYIPISLMIRPLLPRNYLFVFHLLSLISSYFFPVFCFTVTGPSSVFPCCGGDPQSTGCTVNSHHITNDVDPRGFVKTLKSLNS